MDTSSGLASPTEPQGSRREAFPGATLGSSICGTVLGNPGGEGRGWQRTHRLSRAIFLLDSAAAVVAVPNRIDGRRAFLVKIILMIAAVLILWASNATAQERLACAADLRNLCPGIQPGNNNLRTCMREHISELSDQCLLRLAKYAEVRGSLKECGDHIHQQCASVEPAGLEACLKSAVASLSDTCKDALARAVRLTRSSGQRRR